MTCHFPMKNDQFTASGYLEIIIIVPLFSPFFLTDVSHCLVWYDVLCGLALLERMFVWVDLLLAPSTSAWGPGTST